MTPCAFPVCGQPATDANRLGQPMCAGHVRVVIGTTDDVASPTQPHANREQEQDA